MVERKKVIVVENDFFLPLNYAHYVSIYRLRKLRL